MSRPPKTEYFENLKKIFEQLNKAHSNSKNNEEKEMLEKVSMALKMSVDAFQNIQNLPNRNMESMDPVILTQIERVHAATKLIDQWRKALLQKPILQEHQRMKVPPAFGRVAKYEEYAAKKADTNLTEAESAAIEAILLINNNDELAHGLVPSSVQTLDLLDAIDDMKLLFGLYAQPSDQSDINRSEIDWKADEKVYSNWLKTSEDQKIKAAVKQFQDNLLDKLRKIGLGQEFKLAMARYVKASLKTGEFVQGESSQLSKILSENPNIAEFILDNAAMLQEANKKLEAFVKKEYVDKGRKILPKQSASTPTSRRASLNKLEEAKSKLSLSTPSKEHKSITEHYWKENFKKLEAERLQLIGIRHQPSLESIAEFHPKTQEESDVIVECIRKLGLEYYTLYFRKSAEREENAQDTKKMSSEETEKKAQYTRALLELVKVMTPDVGEVDAKKAMRNFDKQIHEKAIEAHQKERTPLISRTVILSRPASPPKKTAEADKNNKIKPDF